MDDESWKNHGSQDDFKHGGLNVEGSSSKKKTNDIDCLRSSELSCLSVNTNVPEDGYFKHGKSIDDASSTINLDKKKREVIVEDNSFCHMHDIKAGSNRSSEGLTCRRHSSTNTSSLPCEDVNNVSFMRRKRKRDMSNLCESSSAASETSETSCNQLSTLNLYDGWSSSSSRNNSYDCDVKLDELQSPKLSLDSYLEQNLQFDDYSARVSQIEADELLARKLQEQYNQEVAGTMSTNEIDANIHGFLQEMDTLSATTTRRDQPDNVSTLIKDSHFAASSTNDLTNNRERSMTDSYACYAQLASHNSSSRSSNRSEHQSSNARRRFHSSEINFETRERNMSDLHAYYTQLASHNSSSRLSNRPQHQMSNARRSFHRPEFELETKLLAELKNFTSMDSEKRRNLMEALQAAFDQTNSALGNGDDYAVFSSLDKNARASEEQIDSLPQSIIQSGKVEEMCAICLEVPSIGDKIRHMPCLHKFHLQCIDVWLRRKACCPVCKWKLS